MATKRKPKAIVMRFERLTVEEVDIVQRVPEAMLLSFAMFWRRWQNLPPLVRAGAAFRAVSSLTRAKTDADDIARHALAQGLLRREKVHANFGIAFSSLLQLMKHFVREADAEAESRGIDGDLR